MVGDLSAAKEQGGAKEVSLIEKQMNGLAGVVGEAARILPTLDVTRGIGEMTVPHGKLGVRDQIKIELAFGDRNQTGDIITRKYETGTAVTVTRGVKDTKLGGMDLRSDTFMQVGYKNDGDVEPDGLRVSFKLEEKGLEEAELFFDAEGVLTSIRVDQDYKDEHLVEVGQGQEEQKKWLSDKLSLVLNKGENGFKRPVDIKGTVAEFINADELRESPFGKNLKVPKLVFKE